MKLDEQTWARVYPWLDKAQDVPAAELEAWLARIIAEQPDVGIPLREVLAQGALLDDDEFFARPVCIPADRHSRVGQQIGAYTIDSLLADGGMGEVWLAHRSDGQFEGQYAVKLLHVDALSTKALERFQREARVLARLTHPNIARLIDAGATVDRQPYMVLEFIDGAHVDQYCESRSLSTRSRVRLFMDVLGAVAHAHSNLVIHRDIKPSNVLVTADGVVKLLDFGIAKLVGPDLTLEERGQLTRVEEVAMTPSYAAPEQIFGEPLSTATDVYQLGVLLHVLLIGRLPVDTVAATRSERFRAAAEENPVRMSDTVSGGLRKELRGDLDAIIEKSLRKRPHERYTTAAALSADLQRYLDHEPVLARHGLFAYRAKKFVRRYRGAVLSVTAVVIALTVATAVSLIQTHKIRLERDRADQITDFMTQIFKVPDPSEARGNTVTAREILDKSSHQIETGSGLEPSVRWELLQVMANTYVNLGLYARAHSLAQAALDGRREALGEENPKTLESRHQMDRILILEGHVAEAEASLRNTLALELRVLGPQDLRTLQTQNTLVSTLAGAGQYAAAEKLARETLAIETRTLGPRHLLTLETARLLAGALRHENRFAEAEALFRQTLAIQRAVLGVDHPDTLRTEFSIAYLLTLQGRYLEAETIYRDVLATRRHILGDDHPDTADTLTTLAIDLVHIRSRYQEAEALYRQALAVELRQVGPESRVTTRTEEGLANLLGDENRLAEAEPLLREVLRVRRKLLGADDADTLLTQRNLACLLLAQGRRDEAEQLFRVTLARDERVLAPDDRDIFGVKYMLAEALLQEHRPREAEVFARQAFEGQLRTLGPEHFNTLQGLNRLARSLAGLGRYDEAQALYISTIDKIATHRKGGIRSGSWQRRPVTRTKRSNTCNRRSRSATRTSTRWCTMTTSRACTRMRVSRSSSSECRKTRVPRQRSFDQDTVVVCSAASGSRRRTLSSSVAESSHNPIEEPIISGEAVRRAPGLGSGRLRERHAE
jgi:tetratricopeptide (TPR) repeat protein/tRNA A-37 threonylcarbamoyl transferase component Bud32